MSPLRHRLNTVILYIEEPLVEICIVTMEHIKGDGTGVSRLEQQLGFL